MKSKDGPVPLPDQIQWLLNGNARDREVLASPVEKRGMLDG
jgi:hypothetical protein